MSVVYSDLVKVKYLWPGVLTLYSSSTPGGYPQRQRRPTLLHHHRFFFRQDSRSSLGPQIKPPRNSSWCPPVTTASPPPPQAIAVKSENHHDSPPSERCPLGGGNYNPVSPGGELQFRRRSLKEITRVVGRRRRFPHSKGADNLCGQNWPGPLSLDSLRLRCWVVYMCYYHCWI